MCDIFVLNSNILVLIKVYAVLSSHVITSSDVWPELTFCSTPEVYFTLNNASLTCLFGDVRNELSPGQSDGSSPVQYLLSVWVIVVQGLTTPCSLVST